MYIKDQINQAIRNVQNKDKKFGTISSLFEYIKKVERSRMDIENKINIAIESEGISLNEQNEKIDYIPVFRGHSRTTYVLKPSIGREGYSKDLEKQIFLEFKKQYHRYTQEKPQNDMEVLFLAQHYGLPTRLLDWTYNPLAALFFACKNNNEKEKESDGRVYIKMVGNVLRDHTEENEGEKMPETLDKIIDYKKYTPIIPDYTNIRYLNQQSMFFICDPTEEEKGGYITIKKGAKKKILEDLAVCGIDEKFIYPGLEGLSQSIKAKYLSK